MMSQQEMSDRLEIQDLFARYSYAIDDRDWDGLDEVFTADALIDYSEAGGARGTLKEIKAYLGSAMDKFSGFQHLVATMKLELQGDSAHSRTILFNPMIVEKDGGKHVFFVGLWYVDDLVRTPKGWRINHRSEKLSYFHNHPPM